MRNILLFSMILVVCGNSGAVVLIDQNTRNGSFETGQWSPWHFYNDVLVNNPSFASDGMYFAKLETTTGREEIFQNNLYIDKNMGSVFIFQIDVRNGINPFDKLKISASGRTYGGQWVSASPINRFDIPAEAANSWVTIGGTESFNAADWQELDVSTLCFTVGFTQNDQASGELLQGFLDNIVLEQIPEPATASIMIISGLIIVMKRHKMKGK